MHAAGKAPHSSLDRINWRWLRSPVLEAIGVGVLPLTVYYIFQVQPFSLETEIDSFIYAGYSLNLRDLITRYGFPYFSVRFALILPARAASYVFGPVAGYFVLRYGLAALAAGSVYLLARRLGNKPAGWLGALILLSSPIFLRALMTFYADTIGLPMFVVAISCLLMPSKRRGLWYLGAGLACGMAINANLYLAGLTVVLAATNLGLKLLRRKEKALVHIAQHALMVVGVLLITGLGALYYRERFGLTNVLYPSWHFYVTDAKTASLNARAPSYRWLDFSLYIYIPLLILLASVAFLFARYRADRDKLGETQERRLRTLLQSPLLDATLFLAAAEALYFFVEFGMHGYQLEYFFYASYLIGFAIVAITLLFVEVARSGWLRWRLSLAVAGCLALLPIARNSVFPSLTVWAMPAVPIMATVLVALMLASRRREWLGHTGLAALVGFVGVLGVTAPRNVPFSPKQTARADPHYETAIGSSDRTGLNVFEISAQLIDTLPRWTQDPGTIVFWYRSDEPIVNLVQATYLWLPDTIQYGDPGLPTLSAGEISELKGRTPRMLVILGLSPDDITSGQRKLTEAGIQPESVTDIKLHAGAITVYVEKLQFRPSACDQLWRSTSHAWAGLPSCP